MDECLSHTQQLLCFLNILSTSLQKNDLFHEHLDDEGSLQPENNTRTYLRIGLQSYDTK